MNYYFVGKLAVLTNPQVSCLDFHPLYIEFVTSVAAVINKLMWHKLAARPGMIVREKT